MRVSRRKKTSGGKKEEVATLAIPGRLEYLSFADMLLQGIAPTLGMGDDETNAFSIAILEAGTNAIQHGSRLDRSKKVVFSFIVEDDRLSVRVRDEGPGFDPDKVLVVDAPDDLTKHHGRGIFIMKSLMNIVSFTFGAGNGTTVLLSDPRRTAEIC